MGPTVSFNDFIISTIYSFDLCPSVIKLFLFGQQVRLKVCLPVADTARRTPEAGPSLLKKIKSKFRQDGTLIIISMPTMLNFCVDIDKIALAHGDIYKLFSDGYRPRNKGMIPAGERIIRRQHHFLFDF